MSEPTRWAQGYTDMEEDPEGPYVLYEDYIEARADALDVLRSLKEAHVTENVATHERKTGVKVTHTCSDCVRFDRAILNERQP